MFQYRLKKMCNHENYVHILIALKCEQYPVKENIQSNQKKKVKKSKKWYEINYLWFQQIKI